MNSLFTYIQSKYNIAESMLRSIIHFNTNIGMEYIQAQELTDIYRSIYKYNYNIVNALHNVFGDKFIVKAVDRDEYYTYKYNPKSHVYTLHDTTF